MASMKNLKRGQKLYKVTKSKMGNTTMLTASISEIEIQEVHADQNFVFYKGRLGNTAKMHESQLKAWKVKKPQLRELFTGQFVEVKNDTK